MVKRLVVMYCIMAITMVCSGWGFLVHRTVNQLAVYQLPKKMQPFFYKNLPYIVKNAVRPDLRRNTDKTEAPKHFIDAEAYGDSSLWKMPQSWTGAVAAYSKDTVEKYGYVPYWVLIMKDKLTRAFKNSNKDSILFYAADIGHYIADAHVPLHTSINYDGQLTGQKGLHALWESTIPELEINQYNLYNRHRAQYIRNPAKAIWATVRTTYNLLPDVFKMEAEASKNFTDSAKYRIQKRNGKEVKTYTAAFAKAYSQLLGNTINQQLLKSSNLIADFWYTSWVDAGKPDLNTLSDSEFSATDKKALKGENKAYKKNQLIEKNLLMTKQSKEEE